MREHTISAYIQCYANKTALYQTLASFRRVYPNEFITLVSDSGEDFSKFAQHFCLHYYRSDKSCDPRQRIGKDGLGEYLKRIYDHCLSTTSDYVVILEEDVTTLRRINRFPSSDCAGPRFNRLAAPLNRYLQKINNSTQDYGYAMCGGSIFDRLVYISCYEKQNLDLDFLETLDERIVKYSDVGLTVIFLINGYSYSVWEEISEANHRNRRARIYRDAAFDHNNKRWYGVDFDEDLLNKQFMPTTQLANSGDAFADRFRRWWSGSMAPFIRRRWRLGWPSSRVP